MKTKHIRQWLLPIISLGWGLYYAYNAEWFGYFWFMIASIILFLLIGTLSIILESPIRKTIRENMTEEEKTRFDAIPTNTGQSLGIRAVPFVLILGVSYMTYGLQVALYMLPILIPILIALCVPVWRDTKRNTDQALLTSEYALTNGINSLTRNANNRLNPISGSSIKLPEKD